MRRSMKYQQDFQESHLKWGPTENLHWLGVKGNNTNANFPVNLVGAYKHTPEEIILLLVIVTAPEQLSFYSTVCDKSKIYSDLVLNGKDNTNMFTSLIANREIYWNRLLNSTWTSEASNPNRKWNRSNYSPSRRLSIVIPYSQETSLKDITLS